MKSAIRLFTLLAIFVSFTANASTDCQQHQCLAVVDGGSSGSRLHIYAYDIDQSKTPVNIRETWSKKVKPGLAAIELNQMTTDDYLRAIFSGAPSENMPVYFYATAGMRLLSQPKQKQIYGFLQNWFANQPQWQLRRAKTITGTEEGLFGWLAVNYQLGRLNSADKPAVGVLDMGGASVQITFPIEKAERLNDSEVVQLDLYGRHRKLFTHSFLGLGQTEVTHQYLDASPCFINEYKLPIGLAAEGDASVCAKEISLLINNVHRVNRIVQPAMQANPVSNWFVIGGMAELLQSKPFQFEGKQFTNEALLEQANTQICQQPWSVLNAQYDNNEYLYGYCLFPSYYYALMVNGYGIQAKQAVNYLGSNQGGDWTIGVVLNQNI